MYNTESPCYLALRGKEEKHLFDLNPVSVIWVCQILLSGHHSIVNI